MWRPGRGGHPLVARSVCPLRGSSSQSSSRREARDHRTWPVSYKRVSLETLDGLSVVDPFGVTSNSLIM